MWMAILQILESIRDDYLPDEPLHQAFIKIVLFHAACKLDFYQGRSGTVTELARRTGVPRQTVVRKVEELVAAGIMEKQGRGYLPARSFIATAGGAGKYEKRRALLLQAIGCSECLPQKNHQNVQRS
jgi:hypothetical protein